MYGRRSNGSSLTVTVLIILVVVVLVMLLCGGALFGNVFRSPAEESIKATRGAIEAQQTQYHFGQTQTADAQHQQHAATATYAALLNQPTRAWETATAAVRVSTLPTVGSATNWSLPAVLVIGAIIGVLLVAFAIFCWHAAFFRPRTVRTTLPRPPLSVPPVQMPTHNPNTSHTDETLSRHPRHNPPTKNDRP
jgi:Sec-independent protein translocase protein TatA